MAPAPIRTTIATVDPAKVVHWLATNRHHTGSWNAIRTALWQGLAYHGARNRQHLADNPKALWRAFVEDVCDAAESKGMHFDQMARYQLVSRRPVEGFADALCAVLELDAQAPELASRLRDAEATGFARGKRGPGRRGQEGANQMAAPTEHGEALALDSVLGLAERIDKDELGKPLPMASEQAHANSRAARKFAENLQIEGSPSAHKDNRYASILDMVEARRAALGNKQR